MKKTWKLLSLAFPYTPAWLFAMLCMLIFTLCNTVSVMGMIPLIDRVLSNKPIQISLSMNIPFQGAFNHFLDFLNNQDPLQLLNMICVFLICATVLKGISEYLQVSIMEWVCQKVSKDLRIKLFRNFFKLPFSFFQGAKTGELISRIALDVNVVQTVFSGRFTNTILDSLHFFPFLGIVLIIDWRMTVIAFIVLPLTLLPIIFVGRQVRKLTHKTQQNLADISSSVFEVLNAMKVIKVFGQIEKEDKKFANVCEKTIKARVKSQRKEAILSPITEWVGVSTGVFLLWWFAPKVIKSEMSLGTFITYITCISCMVKPIKTIGRIQVMFQNAMGAADRIFDQLEQNVETSEVTGDKFPVSFKDTIRFDHVSFAYNKDNPVLQDISFEIKRGEVIALVGPSGSGKTTIANMIPRFFDPQSGSVTMDGKDFKTIHVESLRKIMAMVTQEPVMFNGTIRENISYGNPEASEEEIVKAAKLARAHEFISAMPDQYDTLVGERGFRLSGGEKQRISIARALLINPDIIIFDEATSALDTENEKYVQEAIDQVMENRTVFIIAHRLSTVSKADKILVLEKGIVVQSGKHKDLISQPGLYKKLYEMNFEG